MLVLQQAPGRKDVAQEEGGSGEVAGGWRDNRLLSGWLSCLQEGAEPLFRDNKGEWSCLSVCLSV